MKDITCLLVVILLSGVASSLQAHGVTQERIVGTWTQAGTLSITFKSVERVGKLRRPQEPKPPYPYREERVAYSYSKVLGLDASFKPEAASRDRARISLAGTLTVPDSKGPHPAVLMISGSGPQDRNETVAGHRPFLVIADHLTRHGIAVLRYDDRGVGGSTGRFKGATSRDLALDALAGVKYLQTRREIDPKKIGLIGHSEGGLIAPMLGAEHHEIAFIVLMAGPGVTGREILMRQGRLIAKAMGANQKMLAKSDELRERLFAVLEEGQDNVTLRQELETLLSEGWNALSKAERKAFGTRKSFIGQQITRLTDPWFRSFLTYDPCPTLQRVRCPVLAINGERDLQVDPAQNLPPIHKALLGGQSKDFTLVQLPRLNHLFQTSRTGAPAEYPSIEETFAPLALRCISDWISARYVNE